MTNFWLVWKLFGNGWGIAPPYWDGVFYWLVDTSESRKNGRGQFYHWSGGFGCQLTSFEWRMPNPGVRRRLFDHNFRIFSAKRRWLLVEVGWTLVGEIKDGAQLAAMHNKLQKWGGGI